MHAASGSKHPAAAGCRPGRSQPPASGGRHSLRGASASQNLWQRLSSHCSGGRCSPALCQGMQRLSCGIGGARTPRALLRHTPRAVASSLAVRRQHTAAVRPVLALQPKRLPLGCARGHWLSSPQPSREPQRYAPSSPPAATRLPCAAGGAAFSSPPSPPQGRYPARYAVNAAVGGPVNAAWRPGCPRLVLGCQQL